MGKLIFLLLLIALCSLTTVVNCARPTECELPSETGPCRGMFRSHYFNPSKNLCEEFVYGGCGGNDNRFNTEEECVAKCGDEKHNNGRMHENK